MPNKFNEQDVIHKGLVPSQKALELMLENAGPVGIENLDIAKCNGRILAADVTALRTQPPFDASAMDGYAVRQSDLDTIPCTLKLIGQSAAGKAFIGNVDKGEAVRTFTGAPIPNGADTIIIQENTSFTNPKNKSKTGSEIIIEQSAPKGSFIRPAGLDFEIGQVLLVKNQLLNPQNIALAASMNHATLPVFKQPNVAILASGDELVIPGSTLGDSQIIASNNYGIAAIAQSAGANVKNLGIASDSVEDLKSKITNALKEDADLIITSGGASVGDHDLVKPVMQSLGFVFSFIKIAMKPGKPLIFGKATIDGKERRYLGLAGNPVSSLVSSHIYLKPLIQLLAGRPPEFIKPITANLTQAIDKNGDRKDFMRGVAKRMEDGKIEVHAFAIQDSSMLAILNQANCLIIRPIWADKAQIGDEVPIILLQDI